MERFLTSDRFISFHRNKLDVKDYPEDKLNIAYLDRKFDQFQYHLNESSDDLKIKTLKEIHNQLQDGDEIYSYAIRHTVILEIIFKHLKNNKNEEIRINSALCFRQFCRLHSAKKLLNDCDYLKNLSSIFDDSEQKVRLYVVEGLIFYASFREGQEAFINNNVLETIIKKVSNEKNELILNTFMTLVNCILHSDKASQIALDNNYVQVLKSHINHTKTKIRISVFTNLGSLSMSESGKESCTNEGDLIKNCLVQINTQLELIGMKSKPSYYYEKDTTELLIALTRFILAVTILKRGKVEVFENKGLDLSLKLLNAVTDEQVIINVIQLIGNTAEEPRARKFMLSKLNEIDKFKSNSNEFIKEQSELTLKIITWMP